jgi:hypothetical protein
MGYRLLRKDVEVLHGVIQNDAGHSDTSQGIGHIDSGVGNVSSIIHAAKVQEKSHITKFLG